MQGSTVVIGAPDGDMQQYLDSLRRLLSLDIAIMAPGHGYLIGRPHREVRRLIEHRLWREARVMQAVESRGPATVEELLDDVYPDVMPVLRGPAAQSLAAHLRKLIADGAVTVKGGRYRPAASLKRRFTDRTSATFARLFERCWARMNKHRAADVPETY